MPDGKDGQRKTDSTSRMWVESQPGPSRSQPCRQGYCGYCRVIYSSLEQHLSSSRHRECVRASSRGSSTVSSVSSSRTSSLMERFLQDVIQHHPHQYNDTRPSHADLPSLSSPLLPREELAELCVSHDDSRSLGTREELPSSDGASYQLAYPAGRRRHTQPIRTPPLPPQPRTDGLPWFSWEKERREAQRDEAFSSDHTDILDQTIEEVIQTRCYGLSSAPCQQGRRSFHFSLPDSLETDSGDWDTPVQVRRSNTLLHAPTRSNTLLHAPTRSYTLQHAPTRSYTLQHAPTRSNTLQHAPTRSNTLLHAPTRSYTLLHAPTRSTLLHAPTPGEQTQRQPLGNRPARRWFWNEEEQPPTHTPHTPVPLTHPSHTPVPLTHPSHTPVPLTHPSHTPVPLTHPSHTPVQVIQTEARDLSCLTEVKVDLEDRVYSHQLDSALHGERRGDGREAGYRAMPVEEILPAPPYIPESFKGKTWAQIEREDEEKVENLVRQFRQGSFLCYFDSESLA
uniref:uncharacterized protein n=1 Tax=Centroberyx gerrardi TaxID=166262 RepID=UPI003AACAEF3